jgi:hypothetical protein
LRGMSPMCDHSSIHLSENLFLKVYRCWDLERVPTGFVPRELRRALKDQTGQINRNTWEADLALAIKYALV